MRLRRRRVAAVHRTRGSSSIAVSTPKGGCVILGNIATRGSLIYPLRMSRFPAADLAPYQAPESGHSAVCAAAEHSRILAIWTADLKDDCEQL